MKKQLIILTLYLFHLPSIGQNLPLIKASPIDSLDYRYESSIEKYKTSENWTIWSAPFDSITSTTALKANSKNNYSAVQMNDLNLETAWVEGANGLGIGEKITVYFDFEGGTMKYGTAYQFFGVINVFNGYCKSLKLWQENGRIKTLKVYYNATPICLIELVDTWHLQEVSIAHFFKNSYFQQYLDAPFEILRGDRLTFEIRDVYAGTKYEDVALSEFLMEGAKN